RRIFGYCKIMLQLINVLHILVSICIIALVLLQRGKGSDMGAGFGSPSTVFGSQGSTPFLVKFTAILAFIFFLTSAVMSFLVGKQIATSGAVPIPMEEKEIPVSK